MKFLAFLFASSLLTFLVSSLSARAGAPERGSRVVTTLAAKAGHVTVVEHPQDDGNLSLLIETANGRKLRNDKLISALDRDEEDVTSYNVSAKTDAAGALVISSVKDWGTSNWTYGYTVAVRDGAYHLARFDYQLTSPKKKGTCSLDLASGSAVVNGRARSFDVPADRLERVDGIDLERICQRLGMN